MSKLDKEIIKAFETDINLFFWLIYKYYQNDFISWLRSEFNANDNDAEEIFQASVVILNENRTQGKLKEFTSSPKTYLFGIGKNVYRDYSRKKRTVDNFSFEDFVKYYDYDEDIIQKIEFEERLEHVEKELKLMGAKCYRLLALFYYENKNYKDIVTILSSYKNSNVAKSSKEKCMKRLRKQLNLKS